MSFTIAILGRPNVGKSTLFNRLTGTRFALVDDMPGVTRDRREGKGRIGPMEFDIFDTAGLEQAPKGSLAARMTEQSQAALEQVDVALLVVDGRIGVTPDDRFFAKLIRKSGKPVILVVNKCESGKAKEGFAEAYSLGMGEPVPISAEHGEGMADLYNALAPYEKKLKVQPKEEAEEEIEENEASSIPSVINIAIVGRPNAGKSTLFNKLLGYERVLTGPEAGITRDSIAVDLEYGGRELKLVDTAGMRKRGNVHAKMEKLAVEDSRRSIQYANVVILMLDAEFALEKQDLTIADHIEKEGRAIVVAVNKWDKVKDKQKYLADLHERLEDVMPQVSGVFVQPISAERGTHIDKLMEAVFNAYETWNKRIPTRKLNTWLEEAMVRHSPPIVNGRRIKIRYMTQIKTRPPTFAVFVSKADKLPDSYQRYLVHSLRHVFNMPGVPVRLVLKTSKNPYAE
ncbi:MAG TPA: ribosome biogenesis GTPase Der [Rickettsiales bacterium]|nr:ribosome biogenesis GTPase Der [Rickettsiales bacterium]